jgi:hypothetical protein
VTYVFAQADSWTYWELDVSYGSSSLRLDDADSGIAGLTGNAPAASSATSTPAEDAADTALDAVHTMFPVLF